MQKNNLQISITDLQVIFCILLFWRHNIFCRHNICGDIIFVEKLYFWKIIFFGDTIFFVFLFLILGYLERRKEDLERRKEGRIG